MKETTCDQMDGYLGKWLSEDERSRFEAHLSNCPECRQFVEEEQRLESLLAQANTACVPVPPALIGRIDQRLRQARRQRVAAWTTGLAAAGVLICAVGARLLMQRVPQAKLVQPPTVAQLPPPAAPTPAKRRSVEVTFEPSSDVIAVPHKTDDPSVTIIWVYPTIKRDQGSNPEPSDLLQHPERNGI
jgi:anti-sigma factor RsiW